MRIAALIVQQKQECVVLRNIRIQIRQAENRRIRLFRVKAAHLFQALLLAPQEQQDTRTLFVTQQTDGRKTLPAQIVLR